MLSELSTPTITKFLAVNLANSSCLASGPPVVPSLPLRQKLVFDHERRQKIWSISLLSKGASE